MPSFEFAICQADKPRANWAKKGDCVAFKPYPNAGWGKREAGHFQFVVVHGLERADAEIMCMKDMSMVEHRRITFPPARWKPEVNSGERIFYDKKLRQDTDGKLTAITP